MMTAIERLLARGAAQDEAKDAAAAIAGALPVDRAVVLSQEILDAALAGDVALVTAVVAEEVEPEPEEIAALEAADRDDDGRRVTTAEIRRRLTL